jgi:hypothetical protein
LNLRRTKWLLLALSLIIMMTRSIEILRILERLAACPRSNNAIFADRSLVRPTLNSLRFPQPFLELRRASCYSLQVHGQVLRVRRLTA